METSQKSPVALVFGGEKFIGYYLKEYLQRNGCRLIGETEAGATAFDYLFILDDTNSDKVEELLDLGKKNQAKILLLTSKDNLEYLADKNLDLRLLTTGQLYGPRMEKEEWEKLCRQDLTLAKKPLYVADAVYGLARAMFASGTRGKKFVLSTSGWEGIKTGDQLNWKPSVSWEEGWSLTKAWFGPVRKTSFPYLLVTVIILLFLFIGYPLFSLALPGFLGVNRLTRIKSALSKTDFVTAQATASKAQKNFAVAKENLTRFRPIFSFLNQEKAFDQMNSYLEAGEKLSLGVIQAGEAVKLGNKLFKATFLQEADKRIISQMIFHVDASYESLSGAQMLLKKSPWEETVNEVRRAMADFLKLAPALSDLLGLDGRRVYLILFQNNTEVRPTGGFIGSYGILTLDKGGMVDFEVEDVYTADGQLKGHVEPPAELKRYLGEAGWYLRDSNWDPDFPTSAIRAAWFLEKETGRTVDGVIGVNLFVAQRILRQVGEIELPDFQEKINAANLFERAEYHSEVGFFPGSTQKKDFLGALARVLFEKIKGADGETTVGLARIAYASFLAKDITVFVNNPVASAALSYLGWDGKLKGNRCEAETACFADYLMIVEANVGVNKANYFVKRNLSHRVKFLENGGIEEKLGIFYQNTSANDVFPAGNYKNYLRVYLPSGIELKEVLIMEPSTGSGQTKRVEDKDLTVSSEHGQTSVGFLLEVPIKESRIIELTYEIPLALTANKGQYRLLLQKQPGIEDESFHVQIGAETGRVIVDFRPLGQLTKEGIVFSLKPDRDLFLAVDWVRLD